MALVLGYYDRQNMGDDQYKITLAKILARSGLEPIFSNPYDITTIPPSVRVIVCGGGDIVNDWFIKKIKALVAKCRLPVYALSIGITYESTINSNYLIFEKIYLRHLTYSDKWPTFYSIPDAGFLLEPKTAPKNGKIGIFLANRPDYEPYQMLNIPNSIYYCMNYSSSPHESDILYYQNRGKEPLVFSTTDDMLQSMAALDFAVCMRYHAHIFCIILGIPFVSIALTPKTRFLMKDHGFVENVASSVDEFSTAYTWALNNKEYLKLKCNKVTSRCKFLLEKFRLPVNKDLPAIRNDLINGLNESLNEEKLAADALLEIVGKSQSDYNWGFADNLKKIKNSDNKFQSITDMLKWLFGDVQKKNTRGLKFLQTLETFEGVHRSGWLDVCKVLKSFESQSGVLCDLYIDATFHWKQQDYIDKGILPFRESWVGFIHHTPTKCFGPHNTQELLENQYFLESLPKCKGLFVLSKTLSTWLKNRLVEEGFPNIPVLVIYHPTELTPMKFDMRNWIEHPTITQVGAWLRNPYAIYALRLPWGVKQVLYGPKMEGYRHPLTWHIANLDKCPSTPSAPSSEGCICRPPNDTTTMTTWMTNYIKAKYKLQNIELRSGEPCCEESVQFEGPVAGMIPRIMSDLQSNYDSVVKLDSLTNEDYDKLLSKTVVFLNLLDCSACNTIVECIVRNTPIIVNPLEAVKEYLGNDYPSYYANGLESVWKVFNPKTMYSVYNYLVKKDKTPFVLDQFMKQMETLLNNIL